MDLYTTSSTCTMGAWCSLTVQTGIVKSVCVHACMRAYMRVCMHVCMIFSYLTVHWATALTDSVLNRHGSSFRRAAYVLGC